MPLNKIRTFVYSCALMGFASSATAQMAGSTHYGSMHTAGPTHSAGMYQTVAPIDTQTYKVDLNKTQVVHLPQKAGAIVVGNPAIADISVHSDKTIFVIGRGYGETNVMVLNIDGQVVMDANIQVINDLPGNGVRVFNGSAGERSTYNCAPYCNPAPVLGDSGEFIASNQGNTVQITNQVANSSGVPSSGGNFNSFGASLQGDPLPVDPVSATSSSSDF